MTTQDPQQLRQRLDQWLVAHGHAPSRARAAALVAAGQVLVNGRVAKASQPVGPEDAVAVQAADHGYVSRGALKLKALLAAVAEHGGCAAEDMFAGLTVVDIGASTGGFSQASLEQGAAVVYAVDVGQGQLHPSVAEDARVVNLEKTDARALAALQLRAEVMVMDVSFISATKVVPPVLAAVAGIRELYLLVKPQFEVGPALVGKGGLVRSEQARQSAVDSIAAMVAAQGFPVRLTMPCPVTGGDGNQEYLLWAQKNEEK